MADRLEAGHYVEVDAATQEGDWVGYVRYVREWSTGGWTAFVECQESTVGKVHAGMTYAVGPAAEYDVIV